MRPQSEAFRQALRSALLRIPSLRFYGEASVAPGKAVSRNTVIYRCRIGPERFVAKVQPTRSKAVALAEFRMLQDLQRNLGAGRIRALQPVAYLEDLGVLVTREEDGRSLRELVQGELLSPASFKEPVEAAVRAAAEALRLFHDRYEQANLVRQYMDFSTKNILVTVRPDGGPPDVVLMDPPEEEIWGSREADIGVMCFDLARIRFLPQFVWRRSVSRRLNRWKALFISHYHGGDRGAVHSADLDRIHEAERLRARQTLGFYLRPWRYGSIGREIARSCYLFPLTCAYYMVGSRRSAVDIRRLLGSDRFNDPWTNGGRGSG